MSAQTCLIIKADKGRSRRLTADYSSIGQNRGAYLIEQQTCTLNLIAFELSVIAKVILKKAMAFYIVLSRFLSELSFVKLLKATLIYCTVTIVLSAIQLTDSQFDTSNSNSSNESTLDPACVDTDASQCSSLPAVCVTCDLFEDGLPVCDYDVNTTFSCRPLDDVMCEVCMTSTIGISAPPQACYCFSCFEKHLTKIDTMCIVACYLCNCLEVLSTLFFPGQEKFFPHISLSLLLSNRGR